MTRVIRQGIVITVRIMDALRLTAAVRAIYHAMPAPLRSRLRLLQLRVGYTRGLLLVPPAELQRTLEKALEMVSQARPLTYLEFGVFMGTSLACMHRAGDARGIEVRMIGFDSFEGLPASAGQESGGVFRSGQFDSDIALTRTNLARNGVPPDAVELVPGWFDSTLTDETRRRLGLTAADIVMIDCDLASSTRIALEFCSPIVDRTVILFDEWDVLDRLGRGPGECEAFDSWLEVHPELVATELPELAYHAGSKGFLVTRAVPSPDRDAARLSTSRPGIA